MNHLWKLALSRLARRAGLLTVVAAVAACDPGPASVAPAAQHTEEATPAQPVPSPQPAAAPTLASAPEDNDRDLLLPAMERNPFEPFRQIAAPPPIDPPVGPDPLFAELSLDELRLIGIVSGEGQPSRAMLVAPDGNGSVVIRGDYVGRGELYRPTPHGPGVEVSWRVARIRPDRVVFVRANPLFPDRQATHILRLYPET